MAGQPINLARGKTVAQHIIEEEIMQLVWTHKVFGLLLYLPVGSGRYQLGAYVFGMPAFTPYIDMWSPL